MNVIKNNTIQTIFSPATARIFRVVILFYFIITINEFELEINNHKLVA
jgi:hypothetical protein